jgi:hypothetical protein
MRQKPSDTVIREAESFISRGGYREISLSSLSSGDYAAVGDLVERLNRNFADRHVSFQLPSLKVSSFSLSLLEKISETRKSGLTFAVETPEEGWQLAINKMVSRDNVLAILREAKRRGWRGAKFYFMIGLPVGELPEREVPAEQPGEPEHESEEARIAGFIASLGRESGMHFNINLGIFVPKPHTPFERVPQIGMAEARRKLDYIRSRLKPLGHRVSVQDTLSPVIEGILSRGDERAGDLIKMAFDRGCRLDAWAEYCRKDLWTELLETHKALEEEIREEKPEGKSLPWHIIKPGLSESYLYDEAAQARNKEFTSPCTEKCTHPCGICSRDRGIVKNSIQYDNLPYVRESAEAPDQRLQPRSDPTLRRIIFSFTKEGRAVFLSHLGVVEVFSMALLRADIPVLYTGGFNPLPRLEICAPLSTGIQAEGEIAAIDTEDDPGTALFIQRMNENLPEGFRIREADTYLIPGGAKKHSLASRLWGFTYSGAGGAADLVKAGDEKTYRAARQEGGSVFGLRRLSVLARAPENPDLGQSFFTAYRSLYPAG